MADGHDSGRGDADPLERYFRPRPAGGAAEGPADDGDIEGVTIDGMPAPRVKVDGRGPRRPGRRISPRAAMSARRQKRFLTLTGTMSAFVLLTSGGAWAFQNYVTGAIDKVHVGGLGKGKDGPKGAMTILVAGVDRRAGLTKEQQRAAKLGHEAGERSDTMVLVHVSRDHDRVSLVSLPRDSYVTIPAHASNGISGEGPKGSRVSARPGKLTWAYQFGGPNLMVSAIKQSTGVVIDHYVEVNFYGFVSMVDALGGVDVCTEQEIDDPKSGLRLPSGKSHVDGLKALAFARARYTLTGGSDLGRIDRQQQFMASLMGQALSSRTLRDPVKSTRFLKAALKSLRVDEKLAGNLPALADQMKDLSTDKVTFATVPLSNPDHKAALWNSAQPQSTVLWNQSQAGELFTRMNRDEELATPTAAPTPTPSKTNGLTVPPDRIQVRVRNGVGTPGLAAQAARSLRTAGFPTTVVPGKTGAGRKNTVIRYGPGRDDSARTLAAALPGAKLKEVSTLGHRVEVIVGGDWSGAKKVKVAAAPEGGQPRRGVETRTASQKICK